jgi:hypothetical protein
LPEDPIKYADVTTAGQKNDSKFKLGFDIFTSAVGGSAAKVGLKGYDVALSALQASGDILDTYFGPQVYQNINFSQARSQFDAK